MTEQLNIAELRRLEAESTPDTSGRLINKVMHALPALLDAAEERDALRAEIEAAKLILPVCCGSLADAADTLRQDRDALRAERDNALHLMRVAEQCAGRANAAKHKSEERERTVFAELRKMLGKDLGGGGGFVEILNGIEGLQEQRDAAESLAWDALCRPDGTHDTSNVQRLCEAHGALKAKLAALVEAAEAMAKGTGLPPNPAHWLDYEQVLMDALAAAKVQP